MYWSDEEQDNYYSVDYFDESDYFEDDNSSSISSTEDEKQIQDYQIKEIKVDDKYYFIKVPIENEDIFTQLLTVIENSDELNGRVHWNSGHYYCNDKRDERFLKIIFDIDSSQYLPIDFSSSTIIFDKEGIINIMNSC